MKVSKLIDMMLSPDKEMRILGITICIKSFTVNEMIQQDPRWNMSVNTSYIKKMASGHLPAEVYYGRFRSNDQSIYVYNLSGCAYIVINSINLVPPHSWIEIKI